MHLVDFTLSAASDNTSAERAHRMIDTYLSRRRRRVLTRTDRGGALTSLVRWRGCGTHKLRPVSTSTSSPRIHHAHQSRFEF